MGNYLGYKNSVEESQTTSTAPKSTALDTVRSTGFILFRRAPPHNSVEYLLMMDSCDYSWGPPNGHMEPGETAYETAIRKAREEAGLNENDFNVIPHFRCEYNYKIGDGRNGHKTKIVTLWLAEVVNLNCDVRISLENLDYRWLPHKEANDFIWSKDLLECFEKCHEKIEDLCL